MRMEILLSAMGHVMEEPTLPSSVAVEVAKEFPLRDGEVPTPEQLLRYAAIGLAVLNDTPLTEAIKIHGE